MTHVPFFQIYERILTANSINFYTHNATDGDSLATCVGLSRLFPEKSQVMCLDSLAGKLATSEFAKEVAYSFTNAHLHVYPDTTHKRMTQIYQQPSIAIDHHINHAEFSDETFVKDWSSCAGLVFRELQNLNIPIPKHVAKAFLMGAITDTGFGQFGDLAKRTQALLDIRDLDEICDSYNPVFVNSFVGITPPQNKWLLSLHPNIKNEILSLYVNKQKMSEIPFIDAKQALQYLTQIYEAKHFIWCYEWDKKLRGSVRSSYVDVNRFAQNYGGGGHKTAAGFMTVNSPQNVINDFTEYVVKNDGE